MTRNRVRNSTHTRRLVCLATACCLGWPAVSYADEPPDSSVEPAAPVGETASPGDETSAKLERKATLVYPDEALETGEHGDVTVLVDVDPTGAVTDVRIESGPDIFREAAIAAGYTLGFAPARRGGEPVPSTVRVFFHFAPPPPADDLLDDDDDIEVVVVHTDDPALKDTHARTTLDEATLEESASDDLAETLAQVPGVTLSRTTADAAKPIIRGQQERRLLVLDDGIRHESQKWGPDHATEIDTFSAGSISVIRGAAGARYGPDAIGGVVLVEPPPLRTAVGVGGKAVIAYNTNGRRPYGAVRLDAVPRGLERLAVRVEGNASRGASLSTPTYVLGNTASEQWNLGVSAQYRWDTGQLRVGWHHYSFRAGVFYGVQNSTPADFEAQLGSVKPVTADLWSTTYAIDRPHQNVSHDQLSLHAKEAGAWGTVEAIYAFQLNRRREFEQVRNAVTGPQFDFLLRTHTLDLAYDHPDARLGAARLEGKVGVQGVFQENIYQGLSLLPNYRGFMGGVFGVERLAFGRVDLEVGGRYDHLGRTAFLPRADYERHLRRETLKDGDCALRDSGGGRCPARYDTGTLSVGGLVHIVPDTLDLKVDLSSASRFPNVDELYLIGSAPSFPVYALGNPSLGVETAWSASSTIGVRTPWVKAEVSGFGSWIDHYIYFAPERNADGQLRYDVTIRGAWPTYGYQPIDAVIYGLDGGAQLGPDAVVGLDVRGAMVRAQNAHTGEYLIGIPPDHLSVTAAVRPRFRGPVDGTELAVTTDLVARQSRTDPTADFAPVPDGYVLLGAHAQTTVTLGSRDLRIGLEGRNLLNTQYREYTSLLRYYANQPGRAVRVRVGIDI